MLHHRTEDLAIRAEHIADRLAEDEEFRRIAKEEFPYSAWPNYWLDAYYTVLSELAGDCNEILAS